METRNRRAVRLVLTCWTLAAAAAPAGAVSCAIEFDEGYVQKGGTAKVHWDVAPGFGEDAGNVSVTGQCTGRAEHPGPALKGEIAFSGVDGDVTCLVIAQVSGSDPKINQPHACKQETTVKVSLPQSTAPGGDVRCYFDKPGCNGSGSPFEAYGQNSNCVANVNADICGGLAGSLMGSGFCAGDIGWKTLAGSAWNAAEPPADEYSATMSGGSLGGATTLSGTARVGKAELLENHTYTLTVRDKAGASVASCSVRIAASTPEQQAQLANQGVGSAPTGIFPAGGSYSIATAAGPASADFNYAPPIPGIILTASSLPADRRGFDTFLGQHRKALYFSVGHWPLPVGRWDLSDPFQPKAPEVGYVAHHPDGGNGPLVFWWHAQVYRGAAAAENAAGDAAMLDWHGGCMTGPGQCLMETADPNGSGYGLVVPNPGYCAIPPTCFAAMRFPATGTPGFGQQIDPQDVGHVGGAAMEAFATSRKLFGYAPAGPVISVFPLTRLSGDAREPYLKTSGTIPWPDASELHVTNIPGREDQFLVAKTRDGFRVGRLDAATGELQGDAAAEFKSPLGGLLSASVHGTTYLLAAESSKVFAPSYMLTSPSLADVVMGVYRLDETTLAVERVGGLSVPTAVRFDGTPKGYIKVMAGGSDSAYPLLAVSAAKGIDVYSLRSVMEEGGDTAPKPDVTIPAVELPATVRSGDVVVPQTPFQGFLAGDGAKSYLYLYRNAYQYNGVAGLDSLFRAVAVGEGSDHAAPVGVYGLTNIDGSPTIRVDRVDVTALAGALSPDSSVVEKSGPKTGTPMAKPTATSSKDPATISGHRERLAGVRSGGRSVLGASGTASAPAAESRSVATTHGAPGAKDESATRVARRGLSALGAFSADEAGGSLAACPADARVEEPVYGKGVRRASQLPNVASRLLTEYEPIAAWVLETQGDFFGAGFRPPCLTAAAHLAYAMNARLPVLGERCDVESWKTPGVALTWEGLEEVSSALRRCGSGAVRGSCPACPAPKG